MRERWELLSISLSFRFLIVSEPVSGCFFCLILDFYAVFFWFLEEFFLIIFRVRLSEFL